MADTNNPSGGQGDNHGASDKMVPEKDLMAVKDALKAKELEVAEKHSSLLKVQGQLDANAKELADLKLAVEKGTALQSELDNLKKSMSSKESRLLELTAITLQRDFGIDMERLKGKTVDELQTIREVLVLAGRVPGQKHDGGSGGTGGHEPTEDDKLRARYPSMFSGK